MERLRKNRQDAETAAMPTSQENTQILENP